MAPRARLIVVSVLSFVAGSLAASGIAYTVFTPVVGFFSDAHYSSAATQGKLYVKLLEMVRAGQTENATNMLEILLDGEVMTLGMYEERSSGAKDPGIYAAARVMREYREKYPRIASDPEVREVIERGLQLGNAETGK